MQNLVNNYQHQRELLEEMASAKESDQPELFEMKKQEYSQALNNGLELLGGMTFNTVNPTPPPPCP